MQDAYLRGPRWRGVGVVLVGVGVGVGVGIGVGVRGGVGVGLELLLPGARVQCNEVDCVRALGTHFLVR